MSSSPASCQRCGQAVAPEADHCAACAKAMEREELQAWATQWASSLAPGREAYFFTVLAAAWDQGFLKARSFTDGAPTHELLDNPFSPEDASL